MMSWSFFSQAQAMKTEEGQEKGDKGCQGILLYSTLILKYKSILSSSKSVKRRNRMEKKSNIEKSSNFATKRKSSPLYCDVDLTASPRGEKFRKSSPSSSLRNQDSLQFECKEIKDIP